MSCGNPSLFVDLIYSPYYTGNIVKTYNRAFAHGFVFMRKEIYMYCRNCGSPLPPHASDVCPNCGTPKGNSSKFCPNCGGPTASSDSRCNNCGAILLSPSASSAAPLKSKLVAGLLGIFLGQFGIHDFYLGYTGRAVMLLVLSLAGWLLSCCTGGISLLLVVFTFFFGLTEGILILVGKISVDGQGRPLGD